MPRQARKPVHDTVRHHRDWLALVEVTGPFLSLPVLRSTWPALDPVEPAEREELRREHGRWRDAPDSEQQAWISWLLRDLLGWGGEYRTDGLETLAVEVPEHDAVLAPSFALVDPASGGEQVKPDTVRLLGLISDCGVGPTGRIPGSAWAATPVDRLAQLCRHHGVELGLATDGRRWALVRAPRGGVTTTAVFDAVAWAEAAERDVVRAFRSLLGRRRFFGVPEEERLPALLHASEAAQEDITEALGVQVRQAVELLVAAIGRADVRERENGGAGLEQVSAHEVYRGAVSVMMRVVFLLFAEERGLLPSDNDLYARAYSAGTLCAGLEQHARESSEDELETRYEAWHRLLALFTAVHDGIDHPRLRMHAHDGSLFDPEAYPWLPRTVDDRTVLHMLRAVQYVWIGTGKNRERRTLSFRQLDVEQIGYVYEGLLSFEGFRADGPVVGVIGKPGLEEEIPLAELEDYATRLRGRPLLAAELAERYKSSGIGTPKALEKKLAPLDPTAHEEARKKLLAVTGGDYALAERLLAFAGIIRTDLRGLPVVILPGALYVTESALRRNTGTHYTPRKLATDVVEHALEPLLYHVGPLQTADRTQWVHRSAEELLQLKVADIAMGSAAFLVAAARYLGAALLDARVREGTVAPPVQGPVSPDADEDSLVVDARREVIEHCLYGVDINPMAVEMAKLSLWLVSMDSRRPFTFLDDRMVVGDSLLGVMNTEQLEYLHLDPRKARELQQGALDWTPDVRGILAKAAALRREIADLELGDDPLAALDTKRALLEQVKIETGQLRLFADLTVGAALAGSQKNTGSRNPSMREAIATDVRISRESLYLEALTLAQHVAAGEGEAAARAKVRRWLATDAVAGAFPREPLHWPLVFPEVFERGGFDAVIGNPPFLGGWKLNSSLGSSYREYLVAEIAGGVRGVRGTADLVAYFAVRIHRLVHGAGQVGILATNTLSQADSREVGLSQVVADGATIRAAIRSEPWPSRSASLEYCAVWVSRGVVSAESIRLLDYEVVSGITVSLERESGSVGRPKRLAVNSGLCTVGFNVLGIGFAMEEGEALAIVGREPASQDVLFPFMNGQDLNSRPDVSASRWVINFQDWSEERASRYSEPFERVQRLVKPERDRNKVASRREKWWRYAEYRRSLIEILHRRKHVIACAIVSSTVVPVIVRTGPVFSHKVCIFDADGFDMLALLSSSIHYWWTASNASSMKADLQYSSSAVFETLARPVLTPELRELGDRLDATRRPLMLARQTGLTKTYNLVFDPTVHDPDIVELREIHQAIDEATVRAYGWDDLLDQLDHGFHPAGRDKRFTIGPAAQRKVLDRLLELNHARYAEEVAKGLHAKKGRKPPAPEGLFG